MRCHSAVVFVTANSAANSDLPLKPESVFSGEAARTPIRFIRFRPPKLERNADGVTLSLPHIRLDRALQFLLGDHLA